MIVLINKPCLNTASGSTPGNEGQFREFNYEHRRLSKVLSDLPAELFEMVAEFVPQGDLCALRLVCRDSAHKTLRTFSGAQFSHKAFALSSPDSLNLAIKIAKHPAFGPCLTKISFFVDAIDLPDKRPRLMFGVPLEQRRPLNQLRMELSTEQDIFRRQTKLHTQALVQFFAALKQHGKVEEVVFTNFNMSLRKPMFNKTLGHHKLFDVYDGGRDPWPHGRTPLVLAAMDATKTTSIHTITVETERTIPERVVYRDRFVSTLASFTNLRGVSFRIAIPEDDFDSPKSQELLAFFKGVTSSSALQHLVLDISLGSKHFEYIETRRGRRLCARPKATDGTPYPSALVGFRDVRELARLVEYAQNVPAFANITFQAHFVVHFG